MVGVQNFLCMLKVKVVGCFIAPRERDDGLKVCQLYLIVRRLRVVVVETFIFLLESLTHSRGPFLLICLCPQRLLLRRELVASEFLSNIPHLLV